MSNIQPGTLLLKGPHWPISLYYFAFTKLYDHQFVRLTFPLMIMSINNNDQYPVQMLGANGAFGFESLGALERAVRLDLLITENDR